MLRCKNVIVLGFAVLLDPTTRAFPGERRDVDFSRDILPILS